ncbi:MAG: sigma-70 family RNA polymerase sigma factor [Chitinophagaceae bacterium]|nr:sigma-70 family RNA polymerase sigma factor [Chitinophagaceae bacterium]
MQTTTDTALLLQLKNEDNASFGVLYASSFPAVLAYVTNHLGNNADAEDVFQEAMMVLLQKIRQPEFVLTSSLKTYLFAIAKNLWLKKLRDNKLITVESFEKFQQQTEPLSFELKTEPTKEEKVNSWFTKITENCQRISKAIFFYKEPMTSLMQKMGWKNKHTAANQQYKCIQQIKKEKEEPAGS